MRPDLTVTPEEMPIVRDFEENLFVRITKEQKGKSIDPEGKLAELSLTHPIFLFISSKKHLLGRAMNWYR